MSEFGYPDFPEVFGLTTIDETVKFLVGLLHLIVIVAGSALRLPMFDEYGFPAHYPLSLFGAPPSDPGVSDFPEVFGLTTIDETVKFLVGLLHLIVIVAGSALRLPMFDEYGFPAHYPLSLFGAPPSDPGVSESGLLNSRVASSASSLSNTLGTERIVASLPNRQMTVEIVLYSRLASRVQQSVLGQYESDFMFKQQAVTILEEFRKDLAEAAQQIDSNNLSRDMHHQYRALDPSVMPNYPGI
ncbi:Arachidonate 5 lipoxygenase [Fasciola gigantica]|uniref:Arachidonate 5 lipoxygenase n=1 Tax=Fasciola gigantica TaxID=46835 RepID=A0A504Y9V7_FASGI|nr:Arachidonate 5 lipoxygenase [Fasciola gigantica]